ncbi:hypothetical protein GCM10025868_28940 [Angustibacter aerolatus]|uniref:Uncharacterized protein n=1 Tax=Angustibacter aerolatus TaxID=1162965 RepID=A0ABQ6JIG7_9ACTN|nr:hypothetical protein GCM10025868_28940 [Angustibacter aerolatus]
MVWRERTSPCASLARTGAKAPFVISNRTLSTHLVTRLRARGIPAYGPT